MHHQVAVLVVGQRPRHQPTQEIVAVWGGKDLLECVGFAVAVTAAGHCKQVQIVIAENRYRVLAQGMDKSQHFQRLRTAVHEVADEPELIAVGRELQFREQGAQFGITALHIPDRITAHCKIPGMANRNGRMGTLNR